MEICIDHFHFLSQLAPFRIGSFSTNVEFVVFECPQEGRKTMMYHQVKWKVKKHSFYFERKCLSTYDVQSVLFNFDTNIHWSLNGEVLPKALLTHVQIITSLRSLLQPVIPSSYENACKKHFIWLQLSQEEAKVQPACGEIVCSVDQVLSVAWQQCYFIRMDYYYTVRSSIVSVK